jgi:hypothetical protein
MCILISIVCVCVCVCVCARVHVHVCVCVCVCGVYIYFIGWEATGVDKGAQGRKYIPKLKNPFIKQPSLSVDISFSCPASLLNTI